ncbi:MAG: hypothetical protein ABL984_17460 [Pyrinomonadaceae bacterium]
MTKTRSSVMLEREYLRTSQTGISLHCHTKYSKEFLDFVPYYAEMYPVVSSLFRMGCRQFEKRNGSLPNFNLGHWEPPLDAHQLIVSESASLESLDLTPIVSITDHDSIQAGLDLNARGDSTHPISMEWTVPFGEAYFHVGVHNLPPEQADELSRILLEYTSSTGKSTELNEVLSLLNQFPEVLIVLNHPSWDIEMIGQQRHDHALRSFTRIHGHYFHAIELNGFRPWAENQIAIRLAEELDLPIVSGGDRHCLHHNSMINITNADSFSEFVEEVRFDKQSQVLILPEYSKSLLHRQISSISQILGEFPSFPESRRKWSQRIYFDWQDGRGLRSLATRWSRHEPGQYRLAIQLMNLLGASWLGKIWELVDPVMDVDAIAESLETATRLRSGGTAESNRQTRQPQFFTPPIDSVS